MSVFLEGDLGSGKTTFVKGLVQGFGIKKLVRSSSFVIVSEYKSKWAIIYHIDLYRLKGNHDFENLGLEEFLFGDAICVVEWAERLKRVSIPHTYDLHFTWLGENRRQITITKMTS